MIADFWQDLRYGARMLLRNTIFTVVAALTLALGIGVNTTIFTLFYSVALRPLPVKDPEGVVNVYQTFTGENSRRVSGNRYLLSYPEYVNYRDQTRVFSGLAAYAGTEFTLTSWKPFSAVTQTFCRTKYWAGSKVGSSSMLLTKPTTVPSGVMVGANEVYVTLVAIGVTLVAVMSRS